MSVTEGTQKIPRFQFPYLKVSMINYGNQPSHVPDNYPQKQPQRHYGSRAQAAGSLKCIKLLYKLIPSVGTSGTHTGQSERPTDTFVCPSRVMVKKRRLQKGLFN